VKAATLHVSGDTAKIILNSNGQSSSPSSLEMVAQNQTLSLAGAMDVAGRLSAQDVVTNAGASLNMILAVNSNLSATVASQQAEIDALLVRVRDLERVTTSPPPSPAPPPAPPLLTNGGFEDGVSSGWTNVGSGSPGLRTGGSSNPAGSSGSSPAAEGSKFAHLVGGCGDYAGAGLEQTVTGLSVGASYNLTFAAGAYYSTNGAHGLASGNRGTASARSTAGVEWAALAFSTDAITTGTPSSLNGNWEYKSLVFTAQSSTAVIRFVDHTTNKLDCIDIDDVRLTPM